VTFGPDGNLYVCSMYGVEILRYDAQTCAFLDVCRGLGLLLERGNGTVVDVVVVGVGYWGPNLARNFMSLGALEHVIACDMDAKRLSAVCRQLPGLQASTSLTDTLARPDVEAVNPSSRTAAQRKSFHVLQYNRPLVEQGGGTALRNNIAIRAIDLLGAQAESSTGLFSRDSVRIRIQ